VEEERNNTCRQCGASIGPDEELCPQCGGELSNESVRPYTEVRPRPINPGSTGCRACFILVVLLAAAFGIIYFGFTNKPTISGPQSPAPQGTQNPIQNQ
jgi:hypothetical protein